MIGRTPSGYIGTSPAWFSRLLCFAIITFVRVGPVAQRLEQQTHNLLVVGSNPTGPTIFPITYADFDPFCDPLAEIAMLTTLEYASRMSAVMASR